ncbi:MAG TPA: OmpA family protein [Candidatus Kapabacteria bacterium]|nr:OmpA family protein [Candidatus Kapabacteria bacterium]
MNRFCIIIVCSLLCACSAAFAQKKEALEASRYGFELEKQDKFAEALYQYNKAIAADPKYPYPVERIGAMYQKLHNYPRAIEFLRRAIALDPNFDDYNYYNIGFNYKVLHKLDSALIYYKLFLQRMKPLIAEDSAAVRDADFLESVMARSIELQKQPKNTDEPVKLGGDINSAYDDFAPAITADGSLLFYTSRRPSTNTAVFSETKDYGDDIFASRKDDKGNWTASVALPAPINSVDDEGAAGISPDGQKVYYSLCRRADGYGDCDIYESVLTGSDWSHPKNLGREFNSPLWDGQPSVSPDGNALYFSSKRVGSIEGSEDLWVAYRNTDNTWGIPINLGPAINTPYSERSPFMAADGVTLYFSSNGHPGYGGHDLFMTRKQTDGTWSEPINLGSPINSASDDEFLSIPARGTTIFYASKRGKTGLDIYEGKLPKNLMPYAVTLVSGMVTDKHTGKPLGAKVELTDLQKDEAIGTYFSNSTTGKFYFPVAAGKTYGVTATATSYTFFSQHFSVPDSSKYNEINYKIELMPLDTSGEIATTTIKDTNQKNQAASTPIQLNNIFFDFNKATLRPESIPELKQLIKFLAQNTKVRIEISGHTDSVGTSAYNLKLSQDRADAVREYLLSHSNITPARITAKGYGETKPVAANDTEENKQKNRRTEFLILRKQ